MPGSMPPSSHRAPADDSYPPDNSSPPTGGNRRKRRPDDTRRRRNWAPHLPRRRWSRLVASAIVVALIPIGVSVGHALTMPGGGTFSERMAEWARDHYLGAVVTFGEWLTYQPPKVGGKPSFALTGPSAAAPAGRPASTGRHKVLPADPPPPTLTSMAGRPLPGEGHWRVLGTADGQPAIWGTYLRASRVYSSYVAGIVSMNQSLLRFELRPGAEDPGPGNWHAEDWIPPGTRRGLLATFNSGFKIASSDGGFYLNGATSGTLTRGVASEVYYRDGHIAIGVWGQSVRMTPDVVGVRQNLHLIVSQGHVPSSVDYNVETSWGATLGGSYYVWRSGIGITSDDRVIFVYGPALTVRELAELLQHAGAVTAMQLDINPDWMSFMYYLHDESANPRPVNLLPDQVQPADRYYTPVSRDFTAVYAR
ncbi:MAG TPA: phosphodiester glycosidase family protein [Streptosporangiaceae bacterium]|nr:phosphodiester glycosidase family protein [Streptosporangiaceae bacterium]